MPFHVIQAIWWRHQMETFSALLALCEGKSPVTGEFPSQRPVTRSFDVFFDLCLNKRLSKQSRCWWFKTPSCSLWRHCNDSICHNANGNIFHDVDKFTWGYFSLTLNSIPVWISNYIHCKNVHYKITLQKYMKSFVHSQTSMVQSLRFGKGKVISSRTLLGSW